MSVATEKEDADRTSQAQNRASHTAVDVLRKRVWLVIAVPYIIGVLWTLSHPIVSVVTGELKCRGFFIDENSLDPGSFRYDSRITFAPKIQGVSSLCRGIDLVSSSQDNIECIQHDLFEIVMITPSANAVSPLSESIVFVIPSSEEWFVSPFHNGMIQFTKRLASPVSSPWLAKTILLVSPTSSSNQTAADAVLSFLESFLGLSSESSSSTSLPPSFATSMIRNLIVLEIDDAFTGPPINEVLLLPQGRRGLLPNLDLVFLFMTVFSRASFLDSHRQNNVFLVHPYSNATQSWRKWVISNIPGPPLLRNWIAELGDLGLFLWTLAVGPYPAHGPALERGIDSLTLRIHFGATPPRLQSEFIVECFQWLDGIVRALSNLHERLHHSITQYLMPSPFKFVSHSEYLIPQLLLILPLVVRAISLILCDIERFNIKSLTILVVIWTIALGIHELAVFLNTNQLTLILALIYGSIMMTPQFLPTTMALSMQQSLHFLICLSALYVFIPLVLGHVALALPSAILFTPLIAMLSHQQRGLRQMLFMPLLLILTWPPLLILPILGRYTPYVSLVYIPLHLLVSVLWILKLGL